MEIIASILGGLVGGLFTFLGVLITIQYEKEKEKKKERIRILEKEEEIFKNKPRLEIVDYNGPGQYNQNIDADLSLLICEIKDYKKEDRHRFYYDKDMIKPENWVTIEYVFKNTGNTEIDHLYFSTTLVKNTAIFNVLDGEYESYYRNNLLNYSVILEKNIKPGAAIKVKINYLTNKIIDSNIGSATIGVWLIDENNRWWTQSLFAPHNKIYNSGKTSREMWKECTDVTTAIKCFENPMLW